MRVGDISGSGALSRFVAKSVPGDPQRNRDIVHTVMLTSLAFNGVFGLLMWILAGSLLPLFVSQEHMGEAQLLVPYALASVVLGANAVAVTSAIDGTHHADQRAVVVTAASLLFLVSCWVLVPRFGVLGFGAAQVLQPITILLIGWVVLRRHIPNLGWLPVHWRSGAFAETTAYAVKLNAIGIMGLLFEPLAKFAFNHTGGPAAVAIYELASRLVIQVRGLVIAAATPLIPAFAAFSGPESTEFQRTLEKSIRIAALAAIGVCAITLCAAPIMSLVVLGRLSGELLSFNAGLTAGWALNVVAVSMYFAAQAHGILFWNFVSHALIAACVVLGAFVLGPLWGVWGLVAAITSGLLISTFAVLFGNAHSLGLGSLLHRVRISLISACGAIPLLCAAGWLAARLFGG